jgi:putative membrane protein
LWKIIFGTVAFVIITVAISIVRYWFFRYQISDDSILIREGVIKKTQLDIKFDRIQAIDTKQNVLDRSFDLVTVKIDTAGSSL